MEVAQSQAKCRWQGVVLRELIAEGSGGGAVARFARPAENEGKRAEFVQNAGQRGKLTGEPERLGDDLRGAADDRGVCGETCVLLPGGAGVRSAGQPVQQAVWRKTGEACGHLQRTLRLIRKLFRCKREEVQQSSRVRSQQAGGGAEVEGRALQQELYAEERRRKYGRGVERR